MLYHGSTEQPPRFRPIRDKSPALEVGSSCGIYTVSHEDDIGSMNKVRYAVVDMRSQHREASHGHVARRHDGETGV